MWSRILLIIIIVFVAISCEKSTLYTDGTAEDIVGTWVEPQYSDTLITYKRALYIPDDKMGITFNSDGSLTEHANSGWCGTPPISYTDYNGEWTANDSIIDITVGFWCGTVQMEWLIISVTESELTYTILNQTYLMEN